MVSPVTGPYSWAQDTLAKPDGVNWTYIKRRQSRTWFRQRKPYDLPLGFEYADRWAWKYVDLRGGIYYQPYTASLSLDNLSLQAAYNKAYAKFVEAVNEQSQWAVNLLEKDKALTMITQRVTQLLKFSRHVARFNFGLAARELKMALVPKGASRSKSFANNWLEYHFGWEPLVKDIGAAVMVLAADFHDRKLTASATDVRGNVFESSHASTSYYRLTDQTTTRVRIRAKIRIKDTDRFLLSQTGFINPLSVLWELVPFSFVVDWFTNVGQVLASLSDFAGIQLIDPHWSYLQLSRRQEKWFYGTPPPWPHSTGEMFIDGDYQSVFAKRQTGILAPKLTVRPMQGLSVTRGATAIALLVGFLGGR